MTAMKPRRRWMGRSSMTKRAGERSKCDRAARRGGSRSAFSVQFANRVVSMSGDPRGFIDDALAQQRTRPPRRADRAELHVRAVDAADSELICALPRRFAAAHANRFGVVSVDAPVPLGRFTL